jgi:hypothetical protein
MIASSLNVREKAYTLSSANKAYINQFDYAVKNFEKISEEEKEKRNKAIRSRFDSWQ